MMIFLLFFTICFTSCNNFDGYSIDAVLPALPEHISGEISVQFSIDYPGASANFKSAHTNMEPGSSFSLSSSLSVLPVVAHATVNGTPIPLFSAGGIFPADLDPHSLQLSWENGFAAETLYKLVLNNIELTNFNIARFEKTLAEKSDNNPWIFEEEDILYALSFHGFNSNFIKKKRSYNLALPVADSEKEEEKYYSSNMLDKRIFRVQNQTLYLEAIPQGRVFLISSPDNFIELFFNAGGWHAYFSNIPTVLSGSW